jgi:site-specific recombinase XerD
VYAHDGLPLGPCWDDVKRLLAACAGDRPVDIRDRALLLLLAVLRQVLSDHLEWRSTRHPAAGADSRVFLGCDGAPLSWWPLHHAFARLREQAGVRRSDGGRYQPRLHDLRHTFAVHRLTEWYRQGADVQRLVYHLSVYLGHRSLAGTQVYLTLTPELLQQAGTRFERYARREGGHA